MNIFTAQFKSKEVTSNVSCDHEIVTSCRTIWSFLVTALSYCIKQGLPYFVISSYCISVISFYFFFPFKCSLATCAVACCACACAACAAAFFLLNKLISSSWWDKQNIKFKRSPFFSFCLPKTLHRWQLHCTSGEWVKEECHVSMNLFCCSTGVDTSLPLLFFFFSRHCYIFGSFSLNTLGIPLITAHIIIVVPAFFSFLPISSSRPLEFFWGAQTWRESVRRN